MPTDEERREVAAYLRNPLIKRGVIDGIDLLPVVGDSTVIITSPHEGSMMSAADLLADLIEPEPERTCRMTKIGGDRILAGWWECSECGPVYPPCKDEIAKWALQRCPRCGAKVVDE